MKKNVKDFILSLVMLWLASPIIAIKAGWRSNSSIDDLFTDPFLRVLLLCILVIFTIVDIIIFVVRQKKAKRAEEEKGLTEYDELLELMKLGNQKIKLKYRALIIFLEAKDDSYAYQILKDEQVLKQGEFSTLDELCEAEMIAKRTIEELWQEVEVITKKEPLGNPPSPVLTDTINKQS